MQVHAEPSYFKAPSSFTAATSPTSQSNQSVGDTLIFIFSQFIDLTAENTVISTQELREEWSNLKKYLHPFNFQKVSEFFGKAKVKQQQHQPNFLNNNNMSIDQIHNMDMFSQPGSVPLSSRTLSSDCSSFSNQGMQQAFQEIIKSLNGSNNGSANNNTVILNAFNNNNSSNNSSNNNISNNNIPNSTSNNTNNNNNNTNNNNSSTLTSNQASFSTNNGTSFVTGSSGTNVNSVQQALNSLLGGGNINKDNSITPLQDRRMSNVVNIPDTSNFEESYSSKLNSTSAAKRKETNPPQYKAIPISTFKLDTTVRCNKHLNQSGNNINRSNSLMNKENSMPEVQVYQAFLTSQKEATQKQQNQQWINYQHQTERVSVTRFCSDSKQYLSPQPPVTSCFNQQGTLSPRVNKRDVNSFGGSFSSGKNYLNNNITSTQQFKQQSAQNTSYNASANQIPQMQTKSINALLSSKESKGCIALLPGHSFGYEVFGSSDNKSMNQNQITVNDFSCEMNQTSESSKENEYLLDRKCDSQRTRSTQKQNKVVNLHSYQVSAQFKPNGENLTSPSKSLKKGTQQQNQNSLNTTQNAMLTQGSGMNNISFNSKSNQNANTTSGSKPTAGRLKLDTEPAVSSSKKQVGTMYTMPSTDQLLEISLNQSENRSAPRSLQSLGQFGGYWNASANLKSKVSTAIYVFNQNSHIIEQMS